ncbi:hypothetical protein JHK87_000860 [Glycine soja]|nr:hypothetical protein JHK87_000860 [Glycine soja]
MRSYGVVKALEKETTTVKENAMCVLVHLLQNREEEKAMIGRGRVIMHLVKLLDGRELRGKKNVATVQYDNKRRVPRDGNSKTPSGLREEKSPSHSQRPAPPRAPEQSSHSDCLEVQTKLAKD